MKFLTILYRQRMIIPRIIPRNIVWNSSNEHALYKLIITISLSLEIDEIYTSL